MANVYVTIAGHRCTAHRGNRGASITLTRALSRAAGHSAASVDAPTAHEIRRRIRVDARQWAAETNAGAVEIYASGPGVQAYMVDEV